VWVLLVVKLSGFAVLDTILASLFPCELTCDDALAWLLTLKVLTGVDDLYSVALIASLPEIICDIVTVSTVGMALGVETSVLLEAAVKLLWTTELSGDVIVLRTLTTGVLISETEVLDVLLLVSLRTEVVDLVTVIFEV
jgi:hypothetical protein